MERWLLERPKLIAAGTSLIIIAFVFALAVQLAAVGTGRGAAGARLAMLLADSAPMAFYLWAVWEVRRVLVGIAGGAAAEAAIPRLLTRIGWALALGTGVRVLGAPLLLWSLRGFTGGGVLYFDASAITLGAVGLLLVLLARLLDRAAAMRAELDAII